MASVLQIATQKLSSIRRTHHRLDDRGGCRVPVYIVEGTQPSPARVRRRQGLPGHEFPRHTQEFSTENTLGGNFVLPAADDSLA